MKELLYFPYDYLKNVILGKNPIKINLKKLFDVLPDNPVVIEAGAFNGADTLSMHYAWPKAQIHAFEPVNEIFATLKKRTKFVKNIHTYNLAISDKTGKATINVSRGQSLASSSLLEPKEHAMAYPNVEFESKIQINTITLNDWAQKYRVPKVDFLWLDMQGFELFALKAGDKILRNVTAVHTEVNLIELYKGSPLYPEVREWMESRGFHVEQEDLGQSDGNVLFIRK